MKYFIDTSVIIDILNSKLDTKYKKILENENNKLFINRLVIVESLRTIPLAKTKIYEKSKATLETFMQVDITPEIYNQAIKLSRFAKKEGKNLKGRCEAIDFIHFITAKFYDLETLSEDKDFAKLDNIYNKYLK
jgi:predicted nucleic acid-binding protein